MSAAWGLSNPTREELREQKRDAVIQEAARAFRQKGFRATSMEDIASTLGVTKGALYRYVRDKHEILFECFRNAQRMSDAALDTAQAHEGLGLAKLKVFFRNFIESFVAQGIAGTIMSDLDELKPEHRLEVIRGRDRIEHGLRQLIADGIVDGSIRQCRPKLAVFGLMGAVNWIPTWYSPEGEFKPDDIAVMLTDLFVNGLGAQS